MCKQSAHHYRGVTTHHFITRFFTGWMLFLMPNQQCQSIEGLVTSIKKYWHIVDLTRYTAPLKLRPYGTIQICLLLLLLAVVNHTASASLRTVHPSLPTVNRSSTFHRDRYQLPAKTSLSSASYHGSWRDATQIHSSGACSCQSIAGTRSIAHTRRRSCR